MKMKNKKQTRKDMKKRPIAITLIIAWMIYIVMRNFFKLFNFGERFELNKLVLGRELAIINYISDVIILIAFVILIFLFIHRIKNSWKYFIVIMIFLTIGALTAIFYIDKGLSILPKEIPKDSFYPFVIVAISLITAFYIFLIYVVYKNRNYFNKSYKLKERKR